jgi:hypothetical protein
MPSPLNPCSSTCVIQCFSIINIFHPKSSSLFIHPHTCGRIFCHISKDYVQCGKEYFWHIPFMSSKDAVKYSILLISSRSCSLAHNITIPNLNESLDSTTIYLFQTKNNTNIHIMHKVSRKSLCPKNKYHLQFRNIDNVHD